MSSRGPLYLNTALSAVVLPPSGSVNIEVDVYCKGGVSVNGFRIDVAADGRTFYSVPFNVNLKSGCDVPVFLKLDVDQYKQFLAGAGTLQIKLFTPDGAQSDEVDLPIIPQGASGLVASLPIYLDRAPGSSLSSVNVTVLGGGKFLLCSKYPRFVSKLSASATNVSYNTLQIQQNDAVDSALINAVTCSLVTDQYDKFALGGATLQLPAAVTADLVKSLLSKVSLPQALAASGVKMYGNVATAVQIGPSAGQGMYIATIGGKKFAYGGQMTIALSQTISGSTNDIISAVKDAAYGYNTACFDGSDGDYTFTPTQCFKGTPYAAYISIVGLTQSSATVQAPVSLYSLNVRTAVVRAVLAPGETPDQFIRANAAIMAAKSGLTGILLIYSGNASDVVNLVNNPDAVLDIVDSFTCNNLPVITGKTASGGAATGLGEYTVKVYRNSNSKAPSITVYDQTGKPLGRSDWQNLFATLYNGLVSGRTIYFVNNNYTPSDQNRSQLCSSLGGVYVPSGINVSAQGLADVCYYIGTDGQNYWDIGYALCLNKTGPLPLMARDIQLGTANVSCNNNICLVQSRNIRGLGDLYTFLGDYMKKDLFNVTLSFSMPYSGQMQVKFQDAAMTASGQGNAWSHTFTYDDYVHTTGNPFLRIAPGTYTLYVSYSVPETKSISGWSQQYSATVTFNGPSQADIQQFKSSLPNRPTSTNNPP
ncbi:MAG: hypothetical protein ACP5I3_09010, partial [Thermoproteus sp.]